MKLMGPSVLARLDRRAQPTSATSASELIHLDIQKLGRLPDGGGKRISPAWPAPRLLGGGGYG